MFKPWVGAHFGCEDRGLASKRLLVLGESHYADEHEVGSVVPNMTHDVFHAYRRGKPERWMRTFDNIAAAVSGRSKPELGRDGVNAIWDELAFYNYVPVVAAPAARQRPDPRHFAAGKEAFTGLLAELRPGAVIVCGYELWGRIVLEHACGYTENPWRPASPFAEFGPEQVPALRMKHPSAAISPKAWTPLIAELLTRAGGSA